MGRKHCGKRRNCSLRAISPFPTVFSKALYCRHVKTRACLGQALNTVPVSRNAQFNQEHLPYTSQKDIVKSSAKQSGGSPRSGQT